MGLTIGFLKDKKEDKETPIENILSKLKESMERDKIDNYITTSILKLIEEAEKLNEEKKEKVNEIIGHIKNYEHPREDVAGWEAALNEAQEALRIALDEEREIKERKHINKKIWEAYQNDLNHAKGMFIALKNARHILIELLKRSEPEMRAKLLSIYTEEELRAMYSLFSEVPGLKKAEESIDIGENIRVLNNLTHAEENSFKVFITNLGAIKERKKIGEKVNLALLHSYRELIAKEKTQILIIKEKENKKLEIINELYNTLDGIFHRAKPVQTQANIIRIPTMDPFTIKDKEFFELFENAVKDYLKEKAKGFLATKENEPILKLILGGLIQRLKEKLEEPLIPPAFNDYKSYIEGMEKNIYRQSSQQRNYPMTHHILRRFLGKKYADYLNVDVEHLEIWPRKLIMVYTEFLRENFYLLRDSYLPTMDEKLILQDTPFNIIYVSFFCITDNEIMDLVSRIDKRVSHIPRQQDSLVRVGGKGLPNLIAI